VGQKKSYWGESERAEQKTKRASRSAEKERNVINRGKFKDSGGGMLERETVEEHLKEGEMARQPAGRGEFAFRLGKGECLGTRNKNE